MSVTEQHINQQIRHIVDFVIELSETNRFMKNSIRNLLKTCFYENKSDQLLMWFAHAIKQYLNQSTKEAQRITCYSPLSLGCCDVLNSKKNSNDIEKKEFVSQLAVVKLNGGLGTSMGCKGPKSLVPISSEGRFIDLIAQQKKWLKDTVGSDVPFYLMNSFNTHLNMQDWAFEFKMFEQHKIPRFNKETLEILPFQGNDVWAPPGHGNIYLSLYEKGILDDLINNGKEYIFISNADNLGATVDINLMAHMINNQYDFMMEITPKTNADIKGGAIVKTDHGYDLLERAQVHPDDIEAFEDIKQFSYFNTNNIWVRVSAIKQAIEANKLTLPIIFNEKNIQGYSAIQCETAMGSALTVFKQSGCIEVDRSRFFPVKKTTDLLLLRSDLIEKNSDGSLKKMMNRELPTITLSSHYNTVANFDQYFSVVPSLKHCTSLCINGPVLFDKPVTFEGDIVIEQSSQQLRPFDSSMIVNKGGKE